MNGNHNFSESIQVGQQYGGNAVTIILLNSKDGGTKRKL